jgi:D-galacturonate reductase
LRPFSAEGGGGYVEQEVQFRFDNGVWFGHSRKRGVECTLEGRTPLEMKISINNHYNGTFFEPHGQYAQRGYGVEVIERFVREVANVEFGGPADGREQRLAETRNRTYNDVSADRQVVATVQTMEAILQEHAASRPNSIVNINDPHGGLVLYAPGSSEPRVLYEGKV